MRILFASVETQADAALSVGDLNRHIKHVLESDPILEDVAVRGEISNWKVHGKGHAYFSLKDDSAQIRCCLWKSSLYGLRFRPNDGDRVIAYGRVEFYPQRGETSFIVESLHFAGQGALWEAFERLKSALAADGLFDQARKKALPEKPARIGLITSATGAAAHDVLSVLSRRWPLAHVVIIPALVQGFDASSDIIRALSWAAAWEDLDVVIVARGGGSAEDLWCFNNETLCRYAADFPIPLVSAVGHETDFTLFDFIADVRAATPTAAAEIMTPDIVELRTEVQEARRRLCHALQYRMTRARERLQALRSRRVLTHPAERFSRERERLQRLRSRLREGANCGVKIERQKLDKYGAQLRALDPMKVLDRGYSLLLDIEGKVLASARQAHTGQQLKAVLHDGELQVTVE